MLQFIRPSPCITPLYIYRHQTECVGHIQMSRFVRVDLEWRVYNLKLIHLSEVPACQQQQFQYCGPQ